MYPTKATSMLTTVLAFWLASTGAAVADNFLYGKVLLVDNGKTVAKAVIELEAVGDKKVTKTYSDDRGIYVFRGLRNGLYVLRVLVGNVPVKIVDDGQAKDALSVRLMGDGKERVILKIAPAKPN